MTARGYSYRLKLPTLAILKVDGQSSFTTIPSGAVVRPIAGPLNGGRLVDMKWDGKAVMMFASDIRERSVRLEEVS